MNKFILIFLLQINTANAEFIKSLKAKIYEAPQMSSKVLYELNQGEEIAIKSLDKNWREISHTKGKGWINSLLISTNPPQTKESLLQKAEDISSNARSRPSALSTAGAARGLLEDNSGMLSSLKEVNVNELVKLESFYISPKDGRLLRKRN